MHRLINPQKHLTEGEDKVFYIHVQNFQNKKLTVLTCLQYYINTTLIDV